MNEQQPFPLSIPEDPGSKEQSLEEEAAAFLDHLSELWGIRGIDEKSLERIAKSDDQRNRLIALVNTDLRTATQAILDKGGPARRYILTRLKKYGDLLKNEGYGKIDSPEKIPTAKTLATGLLRDLLFADMKGHPALAALIIVEKWCEKEDPPPPSHFLPPLKGYHSGVQYGKSYIGNYGLLLDIYDQAYSEVQERYGTSQNTDTLEHKAVMTAARWYRTSLDYTLRRSEGSPYSRPISVRLGGLNPLESIEWARLGPGVRAQFRGMRQSRKLNPSLHNIGRFIGKSGDGGGAGRKEFVLRKEIEEVSVRKSKDRIRARFIGEGFDLTKTKMFGLLKQRNEKDLKAVQFRASLQVEKETKKHQKSIDEINGLELSGADEQLMMDRLNQTHHEQLVSIDKQLAIETLRLESRSPDELITDLGEEHRVLKEKYERRKSLAAKSIDLFFHLNVRYEKEKQAIIDRDNDGDPSSLFRTDLIDWINEAPFGTIKRAHRALRAGVSAENIVIMAATEILFKDEGVTRDRFEQVKQEIANAASSDDFTEKERINYMVEMACILQTAGVSVNYDILSQAHKVKVYSLHGDRARLARIAQRVGKTVIDLLLDSKSNLRKLDKSASLLADLGIDVTNHPSILQDITKLIDEFSLLNQGENINPIVLAISAGYTIEEVLQYPQILSIFLLEHAAVNPNQPNVNTPLFSLPPQIETKANVDDDDDDDDDDKSLLGPRILEKLRTRPLFPVDDVDDDDVS